YNIYRHNGTSAPAQDSCNGGLNGEGFTLLAVTQDTFHTDTLQLQNGMMYCYRVTALLQDGSESLFSNEECFVTQQKGVPIFTHTSVEKTHPYQGVVKVRWIMSPNDTGSENKNKLFTLYRVETGEAGDTIKPVRIFPFDMAITFYDSLRNTEEDIQRYIVSLSDADVDTNTDADADTDVANSMSRFNSVIANQKRSNLEQSATDSLTASPSQHTSISQTLRLQTFPYSRKVVLRWQDDQLWNNRYYRVYRASAAATLAPTDALNFVQIARTPDILYADTTVTNDSTYVYCIEGEGTYFNAQIESPMLNKSNETRATPQVQPPCMPQLISVEGSCNPHQNILQWTVNCDPENIEDIVQYDIYSAPAGDTDYIPALFVIASSQSTQAIYTVTDESPATYRLCYVMTATNSNGEESEYSNAICIDNRACFTLKLPNIFTPNGDGINDIFHPITEQGEAQPQIENFEIQILDRWGKSVFKTKEFPFEWNGNYMNGSSASPDGAYFYVIEFSAPSEGIPIKQIQSGSVVILR
ncbi:MAG: gliding motility-associated C-terminal domain-containing protein, partial [Bacteroidales bacterium]|nr:gliding motility-associated C-terminal domain-containing protein [Bacteroidales bacterium]